MIIDEEKAEKIIDYAIENGINYFDTAYIYHKGESEGFLGKALKKYNREKYYIADKFHLLSNPDYKKQFEEQLCRLETEYIDFYLLHGVRGFTLDKYINSGCIEYFDQLKKAGKIKNLGFSFHGGPEHLKKMMKVYDWDFVQLQLNCFDWKYGDAESIYNVLKDVNIPIMVMEPLRGGLIAKKNEKIQGLLNKLKKGTTAVELAMRWLVDFPQVTVILSGMSEIDQLKENIRIMSDLKKLEDNEREVLSDICDILKKEVAVLCTNCRYCVNACSLSLNIPKLLEIYNEIQFNGI